MIGIKGTGMAPLAVNLKNMGIKISGSDFSEIFFTDELLKKHGLKVMSPFSPGNIPADTELVVSSTAYNSKNLEIQEAEKRGIRILSYPEVIGLLSKSLKSVAVCGSHGKTTTSALLSYILSRSDKGVLHNVGSIVPQLLGYKAKKTDIFVFEADEYQNKFKYFNPDIVVLTNIDYDHPDFFKTDKEYKNTFYEFVSKIPNDGLLIYCSDDKNAKIAAKYAKCKTISYGFNDGADFFSDRNKFRTKLIGRHNILNISAAEICASHLGIPEVTIKRAVAGFRGVKRRLEFIGKKIINGQQCIMIDDYGHHPTEIKTTITGLKNYYPDLELWTIFQPHTFSRTKALFDDFTRCFGDSDKTIILDIYASKREATGDVHSWDLVKAAQRVQSKPIFYKQDTQKAAEFIKSKIKAPSVIMTIGASNVWQLHELL